MSGNINYLRDLDIYDGLSDAEFLCLAQTSRYESKKKSHMLYQLGDKLTDIYVIKSGEVHLFHEVGGKRVIFDVLTPGTVFGAFDDEESVAAHHAEISRDTELCVTPVSEFLALVQERPQMLLSFMKKMAARVKDYEGKLEVSAGSAADKILYEIKRQKERKGKNFWGKFFPVKLYLTHEQLAALTGLSRITVTREMGKLKAAGKVSVDDESGAIDLVL